MRIVRTLKRLMIAALLAVVAPGSAALAAQVIVVIDGSGSSAGQIGGVAKIDIARGALRTILAGSPDNLEIGLVAYGHRVRENCSDIELMAPPGPADTFLAAAARVQSVGRSPIADATVAAAEALTEDEATIIVITDNSDNCAPDPCATISALKDRMPGLTVSVVGIAIPDDEVADIACFAELTGGVYLRAGTASTFEDNLSEALEIAWADRGPPPPPMPTARLMFPTGVVQGQVFAVEFEGPAAAGDEIRIAWAGTPLTSFISAGAVGEGGGPVLLTAPATRGAYELRYWHAERQVILARIPLRLDPLIPAISAPATAQQGADIEVAWQAVARGGETIQIVPVAPLEATPVVVPALRGEPILSLTAPGAPGLYDIILVTGPDHGEPPIPGGGVVLARSRIEILPATISLEASPPIVAGRRFDVVWTGPDGTNDEIRLALAGAPASEFLGNASPSGNSVRLTAPTEAGTYELRYWSAAVGDVLAKRQIEVLPAAIELIAPTEVPGGTTFEVDWTGEAGIGDQLAIVDANGAAAGPAVRVSLFRRVNLMDAPIDAGAYELVYFAGADETVITRHPFTVTAATAGLTAPVQAAPGEPIEIGWQGPAGRFDEIRLVGGDGEILSAIRSIASPVTLSAPEAPATYTVQYWAGGANRVLATTELVVTCAGCAPIEPDAPLRLGPEPAAPRPE